MERFIQMSHLHLTDYEPVIYENAVSLTAEDLHVRMVTHNDRRLNKRVKN